MRAGESTTRIAERLLDLDDPTPRLPQHVRELREAAKLAADTGDREAYEQVVRRWRSQVSRLNQGTGRRAGEHTIRSATQQLVKDLRGARAETIDRAVDRWALDRARYQSRLVARTETIRAYHDATIEAGRDKGYVKGYRWTLAASHPAPDICDVYAGRDPEGLGPGGYSTGSVPAPPHPADLCYLRPIIDRNHFRRRSAQARGEPEPPREWESGQRVSSGEWLRRQPKERQRAIAGPTRLKHLERGRDPDDLFGADGKLRKVHELEGRPPPRRELGPRAGGRRLVQQDRQQGQVEPFPDVNLPPGDTGR